MKRRLLFGCGKIDLWRYRIRQSNLNPQLIQLHNVEMGRNLFSFISLFMNFFFWNCHQIHSIRDSFTVHDSEINHPFDHFHHDRHFLYLFEINENNYMSSFTWLEIIMISLYIISYLWDKRCTAYSFWASQTGENIFFYFFFLKKVTEVSLNFRFCTSIYNWLYANYIGVLSLTALRITSVKMYVCTSHYTWCTQISTNASNSFSWIQFDAHDSFFLFFVVLLFVQLKFRSPCFAPEFIIIVSFHKY